MKRVAQFLLPLFLFAVTGLPALAKEDEELTPNDEAEEFCKEFKKEYKKRPSNQVLEDIDKVVTFYKNEQVDDKGVRKDLLECLAKASTLRDSVVVAHVMKVCGGMDDEVVKLVVGTLNRELKMKVPNDEIYEAALEALRELHSEDPQAMETLKDLLKNKDDSVIARAAYAIAGYAEVSGNTRKDLFEEVLKASEGVYSSSQGGNENMKRRWTIIGDDVMGAMNKLSIPPREGGDFANPAEARSWFNDNKKQSWDREE